MTIPAIEAIFGFTGKKWEGIAKLGEGGQGSTFKVRSAEARKKRNAILSEVQQAVRQIPSVGDPAPWTTKLLEGVRSFLDGDDPASIGALKVFKIPDDQKEAAKAMGRLKQEVEALTRVQAPGIVKLVDADPAQRWMVTECHPGRTLADQSDRYKGRVLEALEAFQPLVQAAAALHAAGVVHRDIKPQNIFLASDGRLVLGDFGIVFFEGDGERLTETFERVGTRDWMAPWANTGMRIDDVTATFDVFPLAKVLWCMVSGQRQLPFWWHRRDAYDLEKLFPDQPYMALVNEILDPCLVDHDDACLSSGKELLTLVEERLAIIGRGADRLRVDLPRPCRVCGRGQYVHWPPDGPKSIDRVFVAVPRSEVEPAVQQMVTQPFHHVGTLAFTTRLFACNACGHIQMFFFPDGKAAAAWG